MPRTFVVGTAGHVDHGKSSLVRALTGTDPDRLIEERERQMTIDLGFAELVSPAGNRLHIVDVPGHERFIRNMLAGAGGIDAALLVVAADDGPMPQTREHLAILDLLGIARGVVALTKTDLVDAEWIEFVEESVRELLKASVLADIDIVPVSSTTSAGLVELQHALDCALDELQRPLALGQPRLPIDRVFSVAGFGTVVTGTLTGAPLQVGDRVDVQPHSLQTRVRGLQSFGETVERAQPGSRVAVNLTNVEVSQVRRGDVLCATGAVRPTMRVDAYVRMLPSAARPLTHNDEVVVFAGSAEIPARVAILAGDRIEPGAGGWIQMRLSRPTVAWQGDRFILRRPSPPETIGGGTVVDVHPARHRRNAPGVVDRLSQLAKGDPADAFIAWLGDRFLPEAQASSFPMGAETAGLAIERLIQQERVQRLGPFLVSASRLTDARSQAVTLVESYHATHRLEAGVPRASVLETMGLTRETLDSLLDTMPELERIGPLVRRRGHRIALDPVRFARAETFLDLLRRACHQPPTPEEAGIEPELVRAMAHLGSIVELNSEIVYLPERLTEAERTLEAALREHGSVSLAEFRDRLGTSRRFAQALLEYFDQRGVTRRVADRRVAARPLPTTEDTERA